MKNLKTIWAALCAVVLVLGVTACVPSSDDSDRTGTIYGFFWVKDQGASLQASDGVNFALTKKLTYTDGSLLDRTYAVLNFTYPAGTDLSKIDYSKYTFNVYSAIPCVKMNIATKEELPEENLTKDYVKAYSVDEVQFDEQGIMSVLFKGDTPEDLKTGEWLFYVEKATEGEVVVSIRIKKLDKVSYMVRSSFSCFTPIESFLATYKKYATDKKLKIRFMSGSDEKVITYEYK